MRWGAVMAIACALAACGDPAVVDPDARTVPRADAIADALPALECPTLACPSPDQGKVTLCGSLLDAETEAPIGESSSAPALCEDLTPRPTTGACGLHVAAYDALMFSGDPSGTAPLMPERTRINTCGQFVLENLPAPALGFIALAVDDHETAGDEHWVTARFMPSMANQRRERLALYVVRNTTNDQWTTSAAAPFGSFGDRGTYLAIFRHRGMAMPGVTVTDNGSPSEAYYFSDTGSMRTTVDPNRTNTGPNGSALVVDSSLANHCGVGADDQLEGCMWPCDLADAVPGIFVVQRNDSETSMGDTCE